MIIFFKVIDMKYNVLVFSADLGSVYLRRKRKRSDLIIWQKSWHPQNNPKINVTTQKRHQNFDDTTIADRLRTVGWSNDSYPTGVVKPVYGIPTFPLYIFRGRAFKHMYSPCDNTFPFIPKVLTLWPWLWPLTYISENSNICHHFWTIRGRTFIFHLYINFDDTFLLITIKKHIPLPWPAYLKSLAFVIFLEPLEEGLSYFTGAFLGMMLLCSYHNILR